MKEVAGVQVPGTPCATPPADLEKLAGYWRDIDKSRAEARRLLKEAGVPEGFTFTFKNRGIPMPYEPLGVWLIDQWRQIGLNVTQEVIEAAAYYGRSAPGDFQVAVDFQCGYIVEPDLDIYKFHLKRARTRPTTAATRTRARRRCTTSRARQPDAEERKQLGPASSRSACSTRKSHYIMTLQWHRIIPHSAKVHGWTITPSHYLNNQLDTVWLVE